MVEQGAHWSAGGQATKKNRKENSIWPSWCEQARRHAGQHGHHDPRADLHQTAPRCLNCTSSSRVAQRVTAAVLHTVVHRGAYRGCRPTQVLYGAARLEWRRGHLKARCGLTLRPQFKDGEYIVWKSRSWNTIRIRLTYRFSVHVCSRAHVSMAVPVFVRTNLMLPCCAALCLTCSALHPAIWVYLIIRGITGKMTSNPEHSNRNLLKRYVLAVHSTASP